MELTEITKIMELKVKYIFLNLLAILFSIFVFSCSELDNNIPPVPEINTHGDSVYSPTSENYHPKTISESPDGMYDCQECHGAYNALNDDFTPDTTGGITGVSCNTFNCHPTIGVHVEGIIEPTSENFHGNYIRNDQWDLRPCKSCHGEDYGGGLVSPSCKDCHTLRNGPENCSTCHGSQGNNAPPQDLNGNTSTGERGVGAHQVHYKGNSEGRTLQCIECHLLPGAVYVPGHIDSELPAEVFMNDSRANTTTNDDNSPNVPIDPNQPRYIPNPVYNPADLTCSNTYCHGYFKNGNIDNKPVWTNPATSTCGSCHGSGTNSLPGGSHINNENCSNCHWDVVDVNQNIIDPSKHIDGLLNLFGNDIKY